MEKIFSVYKPKGLTSFQVIKEIRKLTGIKKVGHAGTLDPLAEGILVVGVGRSATRKLGEISSKEKEYLVKIKLGFFSETDDNEGEKKPVELKEIPERQQVLEALESFVGLIHQIPPKFSAVKVKGKRAYKLARKGKHFELKPRKALIKEIKLLSYSFPFLELKVVTGKGVYIRALARDIGKKLGTGAFVTELKRTRVGNFSLQKSIKLNELPSFFSLLQRAPI
jgi:tRNA pseudouridine55 synthase